MIRLYNHTKTILFIIAAVGLAIIPLGLYALDFRALDSSIGIAQSLQTERPDHDEEQTEPDDHGDSAGEAHEDSLQTDEAEAEDHTGHDHAEEIETDDHDDHEGLEHEAAEPRIVLSQAGPGVLKMEATYPGEITLNLDTLVHIVPSVKGVVRDVKTTLGDRVHQGDALAWIESAELGETKVVYLSKQQELALVETDYAREKVLHDNTMALLDTLKTTTALEQLQSVEKNEMGITRISLITAYSDYLLAKFTYEREKRLFEKQISSEEEFLAAEGEFKKSEANVMATRESVRYDVKRSLLGMERALMVARYEVKAAERKLYVLGLSEKDIANLQNEKNQDLAVYTMTAPFDGTVIEKHITLGEFLQEDSDVFTVANLETVWVDFNVFQKNLPLLKKGQHVTITCDAHSHATEGPVIFISPIVDAETRTTKARVALPNPHQEWQPGSYVNVHVVLHEETVPILIPAAALQRLDNETVVFVPDGDAYDARPVTVGRTNSTHVEIVAGLKPGDPFVAEGAYQLKSEIVTSGLDPHAGHGH